MEIMQKPSPTSAEKSLREFAATRANLMVGCYRKSDANDPETYFAAVVSVLVRWPREVILAVTDPATGIASRINWLPSIAEVTRACEDAYAPVRRRMVRDRAAKGLPAPLRERPKGAELDAQFERLGLKHLRRFQ